MVGALGDKQTHSNKAVSVALDKPAQGMRDITAGCTTSRNSVDRSD